MEKLGSPSMSLFCEVYLEAIDRLSKKIEMEDIRVESIKENSRSISAELDSLQRKPKENRKQFVVRVIEISGLNSPYCLFEFETQDGKVYKSDFRDFVDSDFIVEVAERDTEIKVQMVEPKSNSLIGEFVINLRSYSDSRRKEHVERLGNQRFPIEVFYESQVIYSKIEYNKELITSNEERIKKSIEVKNEYRRIRDNLISLFKDQRLETASIKYSPVLLRETVKDVDEEQIRQYNLRQSLVRTSVQPNSTEQRYSMKKPEREDFILQAKPKDDSGVYIDDNFQPRTLRNLESGAMNFRVAPPEKYVKAHKPEWSYFVHLLFYVSIIMFFCSVFVNWDRSSFLSSIASLIYLTWYYMKDDFENLIPAFVLLFTFALCLAFDLLWLIQSSSAYWSKDFYKIDSIKGLDKFIVILSYILVIVEGVAVVFSVILLIKGLQIAKYDSSKKPAVDIRI